MLIVRKASGLVEGGEERERRELAGLDGTVQQAVVRAGIRG